MKKLILFALILFSYSHVHADRIDDYGVPRSTIIPAALFNQDLALYPTGYVYLDYYQVISTGDFNSSLNIYDGSVSSQTAVRSYTNYNVNQYWERYPLDINISSSTRFVLRGNVGASPSVRVKYYFLPRGR